MITNINDVQNVVWFGGIVSNWLRETMKVDSVSKDEKGYYFVVSDNLRNVINNAPAFIKMVIRVEGNWKEDENA